MSYTAQATHGTDGNRLYNGFDLSNGIQPEANYLNEKIAQIESPRHGWTKTKLAGLINAQRDELNLLGKYLENKGYDLSGTCSYNSIDGVFFVISETRKYRIFGQKIFESRHHV